MRGIVAVLAFAIAVGACGDKRPPPAVDSDAGASGFGAPVAPPPGPGDPGACAYATTSPPPPSCTPAPGDEDGDGYTVSDGDCDDHDCTVNPGAYDFPGNGKDEDCSGAADDEVSCDGSLALAGDDPVDAAKALGICRQTALDATGKQKTWGLVSARWQAPDGSAERDPLSRGLLAAFGAALPREGGRMLALSSGSARAPGQPGWQPPQGYDKGYTTGTPAGYPKEAPACPHIITGPAHDGVALEILVRAPTNVRSLAFDQLFYTYEFPDYICSTYNDFFIALLTPPVQGLPDPNIAFDQKGNPISVNNSLLQVCSPQRAGGKTFACPLGSALLAGTGYEGHAATGWITTRAPVPAGSVLRLFFAIWDSGDGLLDSTVLLDKLAWSVDAVTCTQTTPAGR